MPDCPICRRDDAQERHSDLEGVLAFRCARCGDFDIRQDGVVAVSQIGDADRVYLSAWTRNEGLRLCKPPELLRAGIEIILANQRKRGVSEKQDSLLLNFGRQSEHPGHWIQFHEAVDVGLAWADTPDELRFHVAALEGRGWIMSDGTLNPRYSLSSDGWGRFAELERPAGPESNIVFVAMSFAAEFITAWTDGIRPALADAGYEGRRADSSEHLDKIDDRIMAMIRESRFVVVDVTSQNKGAYFEAGFALGLGMV